MTLPIDAVTAIQEKLLAEFSLASATIFENEAESSATSWARLSVRSAARAQDTLGAKTNRRFRSGASVLVQVYTPVNTGVKDATVLAKEVADIFEGESFSGLDFGAAQTRETGPTGKWHQIVVEVPFDFDEIK